MKRLLLCVLLLAACLLTLSGCVAFPVGHEEFTTEYATVIRPTSAPPTKEYAPSVAATSTSEGKVNIGLVGKITTRQPQAQHYESVSLTKRKIIAVGLWPDQAEFVCTYVRPKDALVPMDMPYVGDGEYSFDKPSSVGRGDYEGGLLLNQLTLTLLAAPLQFCVGLFGPFEHEWHYLGKTLETNEFYDKQNGTLHRNRTHDSRDIDLLSKFPEADRQRIGAWTWKDNDKHPQNSFWHGLTSVTLVPWPGIFKYCTYVVHEPVELERTTPVEPKTSVSRKAIPGPYGVFLQIPDLKFAQTLTVPRGETTVPFDLQMAWSAASTRQVYVRFLPPSGGLEEAWDDDARALLELVSGHDFLIVFKSP